MYAGTPTLKEGGFEQYVGNDGIIGERAMRVFDVLWRHPVGKCSWIKNLYSVIINGDTDKGIVFFPMTVTKRIDQSFT